VTWAYRLLLNREPESEAIVAEHIANSPSIARLREVFIGSGEFRARVPSSLKLMLSGDEPPRTMETTGDPTLLRRLFDHVNQSWHHLGETDPFWSVLTAPQYRGKPSQEDIDLFFASGAAEAKRIEAALARIGVALDGEGTCIEYGCGLGRVTRHLAPYFARTVGVDISAAHLKLARELAQDDRIDGLEWLHLDTIDRLSDLPKADFIYSMIVLQHNPPPVIERILVTFARLLKPGGIAYFQVPTYRVDYEFRLAEYLRDQIGRKEMEMHAFPQARVFEIFAEAGAVPLSVVEDGATGNRRGERSNTFAFRKQHGGPLADVGDVRSAYRLLLGRDPDPDGFAVHKNRLDSGTLTPTALADGFIGSGEFKARHDAAAMPVEVSLDGYSFFVRPIDHDIGREILETRNYEPHVAAVVRRLLKPGDTFVDIGANVGYFTAMAAHLVGAAGKVVAVEPMDKNLQLLYATVWRNRFRQVDIHPCAASDADALVPMMTAGDSSNGQVVPAAAGAEVPELFAQARRLDDLLAGLSSVTLLKIDVEGHELRALRGYADGLARHRPYLLSEFHPKCMRENAGIDPADYLSFLFEYAECVEVLHHDGESVACEDAQAVLREWRLADERGGGGGSTHIDLFAAPRAQP
jgi:FkbM family methyltransferase